LSTSVNSTKLVAEQVYATFEDTEFGMLPYIHDLDVIWTGVCIIWDEGVGVELSQGLG